MTSTLTSLVIQIIAGLAGGHVAAAAVHEHAFGAIGHTITSLAGWQQTLPIGACGGSDALIR
jgi:hypothetical protein